jgi:hypothetical protein
VSVVFIIVTNALRDSALSCFGLSDLEQLHAHYGGGLPCRPRRYLTTFFLSLGTQSPGIHLKLRRMKFKHDPGFYCANGLAQALGIDSHAVSRWIRSGHLKAKLRGTARGEKQNGDIYVILEKDVRRFILEHPTEIDLRKVDQIWFLDLVTNGLVRSV